MKNVFVLAALVLASSSFAQAPAQTSPAQTPPASSSPGQDVYVSGHYTKSGKWIDGYYRKRPTKRGSAVSSSKSLVNPAQAPLLPDVSVPRTAPVNSGPTVGHEDFVPSHVTKTGKFIPGHFKKTSHRIRSVRSGTDSLYKPPVKRSHKKSIGLFGG